MKMNRISEVLAEKGVKQTWLADQVNKSYNMVNSYVRNRRQPSIETLFTIAEKLNVLPFQLIIGSDKMQHIITLEKERLKWSLKTFTEATAISSLRKLESEIKEIESDIENGIKEPEEYADALMCLFDSAGRHRIGVEEIISAFAKKLEKNKKRQWKKNPDNSYSHVKDKQSADKTNCRHDKEPVLDKEGYEVCPDCGTYGENC